LAAAVIPVIMIVVVVVVVVVVVCFTVSKAASLTLQTLEERALFFDISIIGNNIKCLLFLVTLLATSFADAAVAPSLRTIANVALPDHKEGINEEGADCKSCAAANFSQAFKIYRVPPV
jgi:hypothetical protein